ncbi:hypothetical protein [Xenorhabdus sp. PB30.3]|nr:hypothetical protein [Xenorhabdus sp. PB30.3]
MNDCSKCGQCVPSCHQGLPKPVPVDPNASGLDMLFKRQPVS